jgi:Asp-tRNA(Asn)/Glu-tRNA(Gln) amidotransferase A subunit family amidase
MQAAVERSAALLARAGATVSEVTLPPLFVDIEPDFAIVNGWEGAMMLEAEIRDHLDRFNAHNRGRVEFVRGLSVQDYAAAGKRLDAARAAMDAQFGECDLFLTPSLTGEAPVGLTEVRGAVFARLWTQMYTPTVNLPLFAGPHGMPVCIQIVGPRDTDDATLAGAAWVDARLREALGDVPAAA